MTRRFRPVIVRKQQYGLIFNIWNAFSGDCATLKKKDRRNIYIKSQKESRLEPPPFPSHVCFLYSKESEQSFSLTASYGTRRYVDKYMYLMCYAHSGRSKLGALGRVESFETCCQWALLSLHITRLVTLPIIKFTVQKVHLSF